MKKTNRIFTILIFIFLYIPMAVLIVASFNTGKDITRFEGFTLHRYRELFQDEQLLRLLGNSILLSVLAAGLSTVLGTLSAVGIYRLKPRMRKVVLSLTNIPMTNPDIVTGVSLSLLFVFVGSTMLGQRESLTFWTLLIAHITFGLPYVILNVMPKLQQMNPALQDAAMDLGCTPMQAFFKVTLHEIMPGVVSGAIMAFTMSLDDFVISYFVTGSDFVTLPVEIYTLTKKPIQPKIYAMFTLLFLLIFLLMVIMNVMQIRGEQNKSKRRATVDSKPKRIAKRVCAAVVALAMLAGVVFLIFSSIPSVTGIHQFTAQFAVLEEDPDAPGTVSFRYVKNPAVDTGYKFLLNQTATGKELGFNGTMNGKYYGTSENIEDMTDVYLEKASDGYTLYFMHDGAKTYLNMLPGESAPMLALQTENENGQPTVYQLNTDTGYVKTSCNGSKWYLGTYGGNSNIGACKTSYITEPITLNVYNWGQYMARGEDGSEDIIALFEKQYPHIKVNYTTYDSNEILYSKLAGGGVSIDVIFPSDYMIARMVQENMLQKLNFDNISNYQYIDEDFKNTAYDPNNEYSVPYTWGTVGIIYNSKYVDEADVTGWELMWNKKYKDKILMFGNSRDAFGIAQFLIGQDINTTDKAELSQAAKKLEEQKPVLQQYVMDQIYSIMENEEAWIAAYYAGDCMTMMESNPNLRFYLPEEQGFNLFIDAACIPKCAQEKEAAELFINFLCDPKISAANMDWVCYSTPISEAKQYLSEDMVNNPIAYPDADKLKKGVSFAFLPEEISRYMEKLFMEVKIS